MQTAERTIDEQIDELAGRYRFREPAAVRAYLDENPDLVQMVAEAPTRIPRFVTTMRPLDLEVFQSPGDEEDTAIVPVVIVDRLDPAVRGQMDRLTRERQVVAGRSAGTRFIVSGEHR